MKKLLKNYATKKAYGGFIFGIVAVLVFSGAVALVFAIVTGAVTPGSHHRLADQNRD